MIRRNMDIPIALILSKCIHGKMPTFPVLPFSIIDKYLFPCRAYKLTLCIFLFLIVASAYLCLITRVYIVHSFIFRYALLIIWLFDVTFPSILCLPFGRLEFAPLTPRSNRDHPTRVMESSYWTVLLYWTVLYFDWVTVDQCCM